MGVFDFVASAGKKIFGIGDANADDKLGKHIGSDADVDLSNLKVKVEGDCVTLSGCVKTQEEKEKAVLAAGNVEGVKRVVDNIYVGDPSTMPTGDAAAADPGWQSKTYTVKSGDTLSKIAKEMYGNANDYPKIFEANKPMLSHPDKIYPGQLLRIPQ